MHNTSILLLCMHVRLHSENDPLFPLFGLGGFGRELIAPFMHLHKRPPLPPNLEEERREIQPNKKSKTFQFLLPLVLILHFFPFLSRKQVTLERIKAKTDKEQRKKKIQQLNHQS